jgi:hypothetical protein
MLISATTVKDTTENVERFVRRNLSAGIDHLVLFIDSEQPEIVDHFAGSAEVTCVPAWDETWWNGTQRPGLNGRQNLNCSVVNALLVGFTWAEWLFHIDADEVVRLDRARLERLDRSVDVVLLEVLESVSHPDAEDEGGWFKRLLTRDERETLVERGLLSSLPNKSYFHGHVIGKSGWRPSHALRGGLHRPRDLSGEAVKGFEADWLQLLHFESQTPTEFERKWRNLVGSGLDRIKVRTERQPVASAVQELLDDHLSTVETELGFRAIYERTTQDRFPELRQLGFLVRVDTDETQYEARRIPPDELGRLRSLLRGARDVPKTEFSGASQERAVSRIDAQEG